jgi:hypothetical protein
MSKEFLKMQKTAGLITESEYKEKCECTLNEYQTDLSIKQEVSHPGSKIDVKLYNDGAVQFCKDNKMVTAFKFTLPSRSEEAFGLIKNYFENNPNDIINEKNLLSDIFKKIKESEKEDIRYIGTIQYINRSYSNECGVKGIQQISWAR